MTWEGLSPPYATIVADPPWHYDEFASDPGASTSKGRAGFRPLRRRLAYSSLSVEEISALPVAELAATDAFCFLWTTSRYLPDAFDVLEGWRFSYRQTLVWHKTGSPSPFGGSIAPNHAEFLLLGKRGRPRALGRMKGSVFAAPKPFTQAKKPACVLDAIEAATPGPRVELFARRQRLGWDHWGFGFESERVS